jgi:hypothetical protein
MNIDIQTLLSKMEQEVIGAKGGEMQKIREHVYSIKILCELILDEKSMYEGVSKLQTERQSMPQNVIQSPGVSVPAQPSRSLSTDDGSNGDSIFDF